MDIKNDTPFIHLFKTISNFYIYDVNTDMILKTNKAVYDYLSSNSKTEPDDDNLRANISALRSEGYLSAHRITEMKHAATDLIEYYLSRKLSQIILQVTQNCNLRCKYCAFSGNYYNRSHTPVNMTFEMAKKGIDYLIDHSIDLKKIHVSFYGGEPLLMFDLIQKCVLYTEQQIVGRIATFSLTTNGTLFTDEIIKFFIQHKIDVMISLDGPREINDKNRKFANSDRGSFDVLMKNLTWIKEKYPEFYRVNLRFNTVIDPQNDFSCVNEFIANTESFEGSPFSSSLINDNYAKEKNELSEEFITEFNYEKFKFYLSKFNKIDKKHVSKLMNASFSLMRRLRAQKQLTSNFLLSDTAHHGGPCIAGSRRLFLNAYGNFYPCEKVSEESEAVKIGNIEDGIDIEKTKMVMNVGKISEDRCKNCWAFTYCDICAIAADDLQKFSDEKVKSKCVSIRNTTESMFKNYCTFRELGYDFDNVPLTAIP